MESTDIVIGLGLFIALVLLYRTIRGYSTKTPTDNVADNTADNEATIITTFDEDIKE